MKSQVLARHLPSLAKLALPELETYLSASMSNPVSTSCTGSGSGILPRRALRKYILCIGRITCAL
ncbi:MAG: hypothetical protein AB8C40_09735 [Gammaproteobacteria bacterium]